MQRGTVLCWRIASINMDRLKCVSLVKELNNLSKNYFILFVHKKIVSAFRFDFRNCITVHVYPNKYHSFVIKEPLYRVGQAQYECRIHQVVIGVCS